MDTILSIIGYITIIAIVVKLSEYCYCKKPKREKKYSTTSVEDIEVNYEIVKADQ